jgi:hypothetical protein
MRAPIRNARNRDDVLRARPIGTTKPDHAFTTLSPGDDGLVRVQLRAPGGDGFTLWVEDSVIRLEPGESCTGVWGIRAMKAASN